MHAQTAEPTMSKTVSCNGPADGSSTHLPSSQSCSSPYLNDASKVLPFRVDCASPDRDEQLIHVSTTLCPSLCQSNDGNNNGNHSNDPPTFSVSVLSGGLSNLLFVVHSSQNSSVLVRIHSDSGLLNREEENKILAFLSGEHKAPTFYGRFQNGRVEEFYNDFEPLERVEMPLYSAQIASLMATLHFTEIPPSVLAPPTTTQGHFWNHIQQWLQLAAEQNQQNTLLEDGLNLDYMQSECTWLQNQLSMHNNPTERSHRDVLSSDCL